MKRLNDVFLEKQIEPLHVFLRAERRGGQRLRLAAREKRRAVHARQHSHFAGDLADLVERARIGTPAPNQHVVAENALAQPLERAIRQLALLFVFFRNRRQDFVLDRVHQRRSFRASGCFAVSSASRSRSPYFSVISL